MLRLLAAAGALFVAVAPAIPSIWAQAASPQQDHRILELRIGDEIEPVLADFVTDAIDRAQGEHASLILITMDTPGGLSTAMESIIQHIVVSTVPVAVYISPAAARGASAGFFILEAADIAAMAPGTHTGAASPLLAIGGVPLNVDETLRKKIMNDATAYLRSIAGKRGRNTTLAESAITDGRAFTETEAIEGKLIDLVANSTDELLARLDGRTIVRFDGSRTALALSHPVRTLVTMSARQAFLARLVQPDVFFVLFILGVLGLYVEFTHPGMIAPGVVGAIALLLALYAAHILPVDFTGVLLILCALTLFILEAKYPSHGVLGIGGIAAMLLGAVMLVKSPLTNAGVSLGVALGVTVPFAIIAIVLTRLVVRSRSWRPSVGAELLVGAEGVVTEAIDPPSSRETTPRGIVFVRGERWRATAPIRIDLGATVRVLKIDGLTLSVEPTAPSDRVIAPPS